MKIQQIVYPMIGIKLGKDIIQMYKQYKHDGKNLKTVTISHQKFEIDQRYQVIDVLGKGAYGKVVSARDTNSEQGKIMAIKKIQGAFEHRILAKRTLRQLKLLRLLDHSNIMRIQNIILPKSREEFEHVYVISEAMDKDLKTFISSKQQLQQQHYKFFLYQLIRGLKYLHSANIIHRDLKPRNLLVNNNFDLKIIDFGLARPILKKMKVNDLTDYVVTRWYRAPQLLFQSNSYTAAVDMWSVGCIFAQLVLRKPFLHGLSTEHQIQLIFQCLGISGLEKMNIIPQDTKKMILKKIPEENINGKDFHQIFGGKISEEGIDFLAKLLQFNPQKRLTAVQALQHPYFSEFHAEDDEPTREEIDDQEFQFQNHKLTTQQLKDLLYQQILLYHNKQFFLQYEQRRKNGESLIEHILKNSNSRNIDPIADDD